MQDVDSGRVGRRRGTFRPEPGNELRTARVAAGISMAEFARRMNASLACVSRWETGRRRPHSNDVVRVAEVLAQQPEQVRAWVSAARPLATETLPGAPGLARLRAERGLSRRQHAADLDVSIATIAHWECSRRKVPAHRLPVLAELLGLRLPDLLREVGRRPLPRRSRLTVLRLRSQLTQRQVAHRLGVTDSLISRWERGACTPGWPSVRRLALIYRVPVRTVASAIGLAAPRCLDQQQWTTANLGDTIREIRLWRGESLTTVATRLGVNYQTLQRWEAGSTVPRPHQLRSLKVALGIDARLPVTA